MNRFPIIPKILVITEGHTEKIYLDHLRQRDMGCSLIVKKASKTDPDSILRSCTQQIKDLGLNLKCGDRAFIVFDWDKTNCELIRNVIAKAKGKGIGVLFSKPCFEIVFLAHFVKDVSVPKDQDDVLSMLEKHIQNYSKTEDYWELLLNKQNNAKKTLNEFSFDERTDFDACCNGSNIFLLFETIRTFGSKKNKL